MVLIGKRKYRYGQMIMSHMASKDLDELHDMAAAIGIDKKHFQNKPGKPHYDVSQNKKIMALKLGAKEVDDREIVLLFKS